MLALDVQQTLLCNRLFMPTHKRLLLLLPALR
jgi:hypothetical protein